MTGPKGDQPRGYWEIVEMEPPHRLLFRDGFANDDGTPNDEFPVTVGAGDDRGDRRRADPHVDRERLPEHRGAGAAAGDGHGGGPDPGRRPDRRDPGSGLRKRGLAMQLDFYDVRFRCDGVIPGPRQSQLEDTSGGFERGGWLAPHFDDRLRAAFITEVFGRRRRVPAGPPDSTAIFAGFWPMQTDAAEPGRPAGSTALPKYVALRPPCEIPPGRQNAEVHQSETWQPAVTGHSRRQDGRRARHVHGSAAACPLPAGERPPRRAEPVRLHPYRGRRRPTPLPRRWHRGRARARSIAQPRGPGSRSPSTTPPRPARRVAERVIEYHEGNALVTPRRSQAIEIQKSVR